MFITVSNSITVTDPTDAVIKWCNDNLILDNPEYEKKIRMGFWLGNTPKYLFLYEKHGNSLVLPYGVQDELLKIASNCSWKFDYPANSFVDYKGAEIPLYDYQIKAVDNLITKGHGILKSAAGSGKTQMGIALTKRYGCKTLWLTHTLDLLNQSEKRAEQYISKKQIGEICAGKIDIADGITFATIQSMSALDLPKYKDIWDVIIVDECHRCAGSPSALTRFYKVLSNLSARHKFGLSATVHRADGLIKSTYALLGNIAYTVPDEAVKDSILKIGVKPVSTGTGLDTKCLNPDGTLNYQQMIRYLTDDSARNSVIIRNLIENRGKSCLILSDRVKHLEKLRYMLPVDMLLDSEIIHGQMVGKSGRLEREKIIKAMVKGELKYLFATYSLAKEGLDIPRLERLFLTTPQKDYAIVTQSIGRVARKFEGKSDPIVYDYVDNIGYLARAYKKRCKIYKENGAYLI